MENNFYQDNFEQFLKESTDNFRMYPSRKVWHSIYNDLHPSRRWPSLSISILLISLIVYVGFNNKTPVTNSEKNITAQINPVQSSLEIAGVPSLNDLMTDPISSGPLGRSVITHPDQVIKANSTANKISNRVNQKTTANRKDQQVTGKLKDVLPKQPENNLNSNQHLLISLNENNPVENASNSNSVDKTVSDNDKTVASISVYDLTDDLKLSAETGPELTTEKKTGEAAVNDNFKLTDSKEKEWMENFAFHNKPFSSLWKSKTTYQFYFTPSVGYRTLSNNSNFTPVTASFISSNGNETDFKKALSQAAAVNMEIGGNIRYTISKNWNFKVGIQFNYTNYAINAYELKHPTMTTLALNDLNNGMTVLSPRATSLANISGVVSKRLNNNTYQISLPLGAEIKIAGKNNLKWYAGASIQPTYVAGGHAYLISSDLKNYVSDKSMIRSWNLNSGVESYVSYKTKGGIIINAGPQLRYQILSTYSNKYTYSEKLYNIGLKIGITTNL